MKILVCIFFLLAVNLLFAQPHSLPFSIIDWEVKFIDAPTPDLLAKKLTTPYKTELEKVRAIFSWIAQHISYNTGILRNTKRFANAKYFVAPVDTNAVWTWSSANEMTAQIILYRRVAVCDGYAKLFNILCDHAGIRSKIILGYARSYVGNSGKFRTNHSWNAVMIDSLWYLLDVTWGSGYVNYANEFVQKTDESYFLTPPKQFILDHYPEDMRWTLLASPPALSEFHHAPFHYKSFVKYNISSYAPLNGIINTSVGDTVKIELLVKDAVRNKNICADPFFDSTILTTSPSSVFLQPCLEGNKIKYSYAVANNTVQWLHIVYNGDMVLLYKLNIRKNKPGF